MSRVSVLKLQSQYNEWVRVDSRGGPVGGWLMLKWGYRAGSIPSQTTIFNQVTPVPLFSEGAVTGGCGVVWCGWYSEACGAERMMRESGMWCGTVWYSLVVWCDTLLWCDISVVWCGVVLCGVDAALRCRHGVVYCGWCGVVWCLCYNGMYVADYSVAQRNGELCDVVHVDSTSVIAVQCHVEQCNYGR